MQHELLSPRNQLVQRARLLARERRERESAGLGVLEGIRLAEEAVSSGLHLEYALYADQFTQIERGAALLQALERAQVPIYPVSSETLERCADTQNPQGIVAVFRPRQWRMEELPPGLIVLLDQVQDPGNAGTVIRSLEALGGAGLVFAGGVDPYSPKVVRSAMGSLFRLPVVQAELESALSDLKSQGRRIFTTDAGGSLTPWCAELTGEVVLVIGNENAGPSDRSRAAADGVISIPMEGPTESLNAGVAASLLIYESMRQRVVR